MKEAGPQIPLHASLTKVKAKVSMYPSYTNERELASSAASLRSAALKRCSNLQLLKSGVET